MTASPRLRLSVGALLLGLSCSALAQNATTSESASVYAGPDDSYPPVAQLDADTPIQVMGCLDDWSWCDVAFEDSRGWLYSPDINYAYQGGYVPLYSYGPGLGLPVLAFSVDAYWGSYYRGRPFYAQRVEWAHRNIRPRHPAGPPPSHDPPPRQAIRFDGAHGGPPGDRSIRLGSADQGRRDNGRPQPNDARRPPDNARPQPERAAPTPQGRPGGNDVREAPHAAPQGHPGSAEAHEVPHAAEAPQGHPEAQAHPEAQGHPAGPQPHAEAQHHEEPHPAPAEHPKEPPHP